MGAAGALEPLCVPQRAPVCPHSMEYPLGHPQRPADCRLRYCFQKQTGFVNHSKAGKVAGTNLYLQNKQICSAPGSPVWLELFEELHGSFPAN